MCMYIEQSNSRILTSFCKDIYFWVKTKGFLAQDTSLNLRRSLRLAVIPKELGAL